jgi:predicted RNA-binding Zn ribbon-like protein
LAGEAQVEPRPASGAGAALAVQPGGRLAAPGHLGLLQAFINTYHDLAGEDGGDLFSTADRLQAWLLEHGLLTRRDHIRPADLDRALAVREGLRGLIVARASASHARGIHQLINPVIAGATLTLRFTHEGPELVPAGSNPLDRALGDLLGRVVPAMIDGTWLRLKVCPGRDCGWAFYDHSRNNSGRWCSMKVCGGREKARVHYRRHRTG